MATAYELLEAFKGGEVEGRACVSKQIMDGNALRESQELFELPVSEFSPLQRCQVCRSTQRVVPLSRLTLS